MPYLPRELENLLIKQIKSFPAVGLTGPRQSGKSTLLLHLLKDSYRYLTFDDQSNQDDFFDDPTRFIRQNNNKVIFDEVQKVPEIFNYIKIAIDNDRDNYGKFILTGSSQFSMVKNITESLAGRIGMFSLLPLQFSEIPAPLRSQSLYKGSYPEIVKRKYENSKLWYSSYIATYLEKDIRHLSNIGDVRDFNRLLRLLAANTSQLLNYSNFANDLGVSVPTVKRWISVLEASYIIFLLPPFYKNFGKRVIKSPKIYFYDTGLAAYLTKVTTKELFENGPMTGSLFENYIVSEIKKKETHTLTNSSLYFFRTNHGIETDLIIEHPTYNEIIEIKFQETFKPKMLAPMKTILTKSDKGYLIYNGSNRQYDDNIFAVNYKDFLLGKKAL